MYVQNRPRHHPALRGFGFRGFGATGLEPLNCPPGEEFDLNAMACVTAGQAVTPVPSGGGSTTSPPTVPPVTLPPANQPPPAKEDDLKYYIIGGFAAVGLLMIVGIASR